jgi:hypothetical protein
MIVKVEKKGDRQRKERGLKPADLRIYLSLTNREPSEHHCERVIVDVRFLDILINIETHVYFRPKDDTASNGSQNGSIGCQRRPLPMFHQ